MSCYGEFVLKTRRFIILAYLKGLLVFSVSLGCAACAYSFGYSQRNLPGGYKSVAIPVFENTTQQVGIEGYFTNELIRQFNRSQVAQVTDKSDSQVTIEGKISSVGFAPQGQIAKEEGDKIKLPTNTVLTVEYQVLVNAEVVLRRNSDQKILWQGRFDGERFYTAPQVGLTVVNSVNPLYNQSARMEVIEGMARDMMAEAHDRMTENF